jgi:hypothetical protein
MMQLWAEGSLSVRVFSNGTQKARAAIVKAVTN